MRTPSPPRQQQQCHKHISYLLVNTSKWDSIRRLLIPEHGPCSPESCTWLKLMDVNKCTLWDKGKMHWTYLYLHFCCVGANPVRAGSAVLGCSGEMWWREVTGASVCLLVVPVLARCVGIRSLLEIIKEKINLGLLLPSLFRLMPQILLERPENRICYSL